MSKIAVIDYGASNLRSVGNALEKLGVSFDVITTPEGLKGADKVILPGVGAAGSAMQALRERGFADAVPTLKVPVLGVCLGLQVFAEFSEEDDTKCLGIITGSVRKFREPNMKIPQIGWNTVTIARYDSLF